jgi:hypothetical protein
MKKISNKNLFFIYFLAHGLSLFFINTEFYDDRLLKNLEYKEFVNIHKQMNEFFHYRVHWFSFFLDYEQWVSGLISFSLFFFSAIVLQKIIETQFSFDNETISLFSLLYLTLPFGLIKFSYTIVPYIFCMTLFICGWYFITKKRWLSLILFFFSFNMNSLLVLYCVPIFSFFLYNNKILNIKNLVCFSIKKIDFLVLPFFYFLIKVFFFKPHGIFEGYNNHYDLIDIFKTPFFQFLDLFRNNLTIGFVIFGVSIAILIYNKYPQLFYKTKVKFHYLIIIFAFFGSLLPYWILGHTPTFTSYSSRHQLLMLISFPFIILYLLNFLTKDFYKFFILLILTLNFSINYKIYFDYFIEQKKINELNKFIINNKKSLADNNIIIINDKYKNPTVTYSKILHDYNNALIKRVLRNEKNFVINIEQIQDYLDGKFDHKFTKQFMASEHQRLENPIFIILSVESYGFLRFEFSIHKIKI